MRVAFDTGAWLRGPGLVALAAMMSLAIACSDADPTGPDAISDAGVDRGSTPDEGGDDGMAGNPDAAAGSSTFVGTLATSDGSVSGSLTLTIEAVGGTLGTQGADSGDPVPVMGECVLTDGSRVALKGTFDTATSAIAFSGGSYSFSGSVGTDENGSPSLIGTFTGPDGDGSFDTVPAGPADGGSGGVEVYCGSFNSTDNVVRGAWNLVVSGSQVSGLACSMSCGNLRGTIDGTGAFTMQYIEGGRVAGNATGTINEDMVSGSWASVDDSRGGPITGTRCN